MPASQPANFNLQEFTDVGQPLVGGRLYTYTYGTTAQQIAYTDPNGTVPHTYTADGAGGQYIALNARGELPAPLYLGAGSYDISLKRADGSTVWTRKADGVDSSLRAWMSSLAAATGAALVGFLPTGAGAAARTLQDKGRDVISVKDFGAKGDGATDDTAAIQSAFTYAATHNEQDYCPAIVFPAGTYIISASLSWNGGSVYLRGEGIARIQPTVLTAASAFPLISLPGSSSRVTIRDLTLYMYGSNCTGISAANLWRQAKIENVQCIGGATGIDLAGGGAADKWGITIEKCRLQDCGYGVRWIMNGQTGRIKDCLFFNSTQIDLVAQTGSQLLIDGCVFESASSALGHAMNIQGIKELTLIGVQGERLGYRNTDTGAVGDYEYYFLNSTVTLIGCRLWGGSYGSVAPGNSRGFGVYLDGSNLKLVNSRIYSFRKVAMKMANGSVCSTDLESQLDFRCLGGTPRFECSSDLGQNYIVNSDYKYWNLDTLTSGGTKPLPLGWARNGYAGTIARTTANLIDPASQAALDLTGSSEPHMTNWIDVSPGEWWTFRGELKTQDTRGYIIAQDQSGAGYFATYDANFNRINATASVDPQDAARTTNSALVVWSFQIPAGVTSMRIKFNGYMWVELPAMYRVKANVTPAGALYSDNDSSFGCWIHLGPPLPHKLSPRLLTDTLTVTDIGGTFYRGQRLDYTNPAAGGYAGLICTTAGAGGSTAVLKTFGAISP